MLNKPQSFNSFVGMNEFKKIIKVMIESAKKQDKVIDHILLYGPPGLGKTTMAYLISKYTSQKIKYINGNMFEKKSDFLTIFSTIKQNDLIFIDEIHAINKSVEELFFSILEENVIDIILGVEGESKIIRFNLPPFTLIGATTKFGLISEPFLERFGLSWHFDYYSNKEIEQIAVNQLRNTSWKIEDDALSNLALHARQTPRVIKRLVQRAIDFAIINKKNNIDAKIVNETLHSLKIYNMGLEHHHIQYLKTLNIAFKNKWVSIDLIAHILKELKISIESKIEPLLFKNHLILKSTRGRKITQKGIEVLNKSVK